MRKLDDWLSAYMDYTDDTEPRELFRKWCGISAIAACLKRKCYLALGREIFYPNFYIVLVGPPAARKGTAMKPAIELLDSLGIVKAADESSRQKLITRLKMCYTVEGDPNNQAGMFSHSSLTIISTELTVFLGYGNLELITTLCKWFDCESTFVYDTISRGEDSVTNVWVNLLGATTPTALKSSLPLDAIGGGFTSRTIFVYEENKAKVVVYPQEKDDLHDKLVNDLEEISMIRGRFVMEDAFLEAYAYFRHLTEESPPFTQPELLGYVDRRQVHLLKLAMIISASRSSDKILTRSDFDVAFSLLRRTEEKMPYVFSGIGKNPLAGVQVRIMSYIAEKGETSIEDILSRFHNDISYQQLLDVLDALTQMKYCFLSVPSHKVKMNPDKLKKGVFPDVIGGREIGGTAQSGKDN